MTETKSIDRRRWLIGGVAVAAGAAGVGLAWRQRLSDERAGSLDAEHASSAPEISNPLWSKRFERPEGGELVMASLKGRPLVLNFWATWCGPCLRELPQINRFHGDFQSRGWQVVGLALDQLQPVKAFLSKRPVTFPVVLGGADGTELAFKYGNVQGALPFTVIFDAQGKVRWRNVGETNYDELSERAKLIQA